MTNRDYAQEDRDFRRGYLTGINDALIELDNRLTDS